MHPFSFRRACAALAITAAGAAALACSQGPGPSSLSSDVTGSDDLSILFSPMYSANDGEHTFKVPAKVDGVKNVKWSASDPSVVDLDVNKDGSVMITTRKAGTVTITAKSGDLAGSSVLTITEATPDDWEAGNQRYNNGIILPRGHHHDAGASDPSAIKQAACTNCHGTGGGSSGDVEHTPMQTGGYSDDELVDIFTKGKKPDGVPQRIMPLERWQKIHQWSMDDDAKKGLVVYLRSLEPKSQGAIDFGGRGRGKGKGDGQGGGQGGGSRSGDGGGAP